MLCQEYFQTAEGKDYYGFKDTNKKKAVTQGVTAKYL
jgi:hypothetical protein